MESPVGPIPLDPVSTTIKASAGEPAFGIYLHWPFCLSKCPYCDFNSHVRAEPIDEPRFLSGLKRELAHRASLTPGRQVSSIFFGGGTPSLMQGSTVAALIDAIAGHWPLAPQVEITLEANPTSVEAERFAAYRAAGVNRVSLGVQALDDAALQSLGRKHSAAEALRAVKTAASLFERYSFDLIYGRPGQTLADWRRELGDALHYARDHLSLYQLTIEPETPFAQLAASGRFTLPEADLGRDLWDLTQEVMNKAGLPAYEVSNHARPGAESRHNLLYWRYGEYAGVGPGAHGRLLTPHGRRAQATLRQPDLWLKTVEERGEGLTEDMPLTREEQADEFLLMGLRLTEGIAPENFRAVAGRDFDPRRLQTLLSEGMLEYTPHGRVRVSAEGFPVLDAVIADLAA
ncbi:radical SAM family heme chaperone HemW [Beijerinckia indica]|uniref:Heme chaperone HemW n=1 Tax=Beijerinckia indica subsp. indica (strain ATCC 9039 / DSM 1715 / NCIMB 8712) TaxID=395963 RepID=B2IEL5_BEII9|nr:radical SAM family heme chaperone HemW [Beijerinckia indica]ACB96955.1 oxygen-independent coproporphyrinogen III oxidase [Beijerinckia indica subsp. indica ATCC 9039]